MKPKVEGKEGRSKSKVNVKTRKLINKNKSKSSGAESTTVPLRSIFCLKNKSKLKEIEKREDCFILDYVPNEPLHKISISKDTNNEVSVIAEKGQVACRDFPHSRHACAKYPFSKTKHEYYCQLCYCYVCDKVAPCTMWTGSSGHCHAMNNEDWELKRVAMREFHKAKKAIVEVDKILSDFCKILYKILPR